MTTQTLRLVDFHNRVADLKMKGTYGYNPTNATILTAESYVYELVVTDTRMFDNVGNRLPSPIVIGVDKYGRQMTLPIDRILACRFCDTKEQGKLKSLAYLMDIYGNIEGILEESHPLFNDYKDIKNKFNELTNKGVKIYQRKG